MKELSKIALAVEPSTTMAIDAMFKQMKAEGRMSSALVLESLTSPPLIILRRLVSRPFGTTKRNIPLQPAPLSCARLSASG